MKITGITCRVVNAEMRNWVFVRVETDQPGLYGWGEATLEWKTRAVTGAVADLEPLLIGLDPRDIEQAVRIMHKHGFWRMGVIGASAISGIEVALWDILGKDLGVPVWRLLGGRTRNRVPVYTHLGLGDMRAVYETMEPQALAEQAGAVVEKGYTALKVVFVPYTHMLAPVRAVDHVARLMEALRAAVGPDIEIMVDFHGRPGSTIAALDYIRALAPGRPLFVEEPVQPGNPEALRDLTLQSPVAIATGERLIGRQEFEPHIRLRAMHVAQPDIAHAGGLAETKKIAAMCETAGIGVAPHNPLGPIASAAALHFAVSTPNFIIQEEMSGAVQWYDDVVQGPVRRIDGAWQVPEGPGLGVEVDEAVAAAHPFKPEIYHTQHAVMPDGTVVDW
ncbi:MAG: galactonate dehydratase [Rhizobiaceae bacterium]|nr:galactonate dehydratase [Rhizobiaceae bacterium]